MKNGKHPEKALTALQVRQLKEPGRYIDGNGLYLVVDPSGAKRWLLRIVVLGKRRDIGLGGLSYVGLAEAREKATAYRKIARDGGDLPLRGEGGIAVDPMDNLSTSVGVLSATPGWKGTAPHQWYILPKWSCGTADRVTVLETDAQERCLAKEPAGDLATWKRDVASMVVKSPPASAALLVALAAPLFVFSGLKEGFIFNIAGNGSSGKTSANSAAASVWGDPRSISSWNATSRGLVEAAAANNDMCLVLDDVEQAAEDPKSRHKKVHELTHALASGNGKNYAKIISGQDQLPKLKFRALVLSSSPASIETVLRANGTLRTDGDRVRLLEYRIPHGDDGGIWAGADGTKVGNDTAAMSNELVAAARANYGVAGRALVEHLVLVQAEVPNLIAKYQKSFLEDLGVTLGSVEGRIAEKVALLYAAGRIAMRAKVLDWSKAQLKASTRAAFAAIIDASSLNVFDPAKIAPLLRSVFGDGVHYPRLKGVSLASYLLPTDVSGCADLDAGRIYARLNSFADEVGELAGKPMTLSDRNSLFAYLVEKGALLPGDGIAPTKTVRFKGGKPKMLVFSIDGLNGVFIGEK